MYYWLMEQDDWKQKFLTIPVSFSVVWEWIYGVLVVIHL